MREKIKNYNMHDFLGIRTNLNFFPDIFEVKNIKSPDLEIIEGNFDFNKDRLKAYYRFPIKSYIKGNKIFLEYTPKKQLLRLSLEDLEGHTKFYFKESLIYKPFHNVIFPAWPSIKNLIRFLLQVKFLQKGVVAIHSATLSKDGKGIILPAWPSTGKSTVSYNLAMKGIEVLGDEISLLGKSGKAYRISESGTFSQKDGSPIFKSKKQFEFNTQKMHEKINMLIFLKKGKPKTEEKAPEDIINILLASTDFEFQNFFTRYTFLTYCFSNNFDPGFIDRESKTILSKFLRRVKCYVVYGDRSNFQKIIEDLI